MKISFFIASLLFSAIILGQSHTLKLRCIKGTSIFPNLTPSGKINGEEYSTIRIYEYGKKRLYDLEYDERVIDGGVIKSTKTVRHWITFYVDSAYGYDYNLSSKKRMRVKLDSAMQREWVYSNNLYSGVSANRSVLTSSKRNSVSGTLVEEYSILSPSDSSEVMKQIFFYSTHVLKNVSISLSKKLDSLKQMRLYKAQTIVLPRKIPGKGITLPTFRTEFALQEIVPPNSTQVLLHLSKLNVQ